MHNAYRATSANEQSTGIRQYIHELRKNMFKDFVKYHAEEFWAKHKHHVKYIAFATAIGALVAIPVPGIGPHGGALIGALAGVALLVKKHAVEIGNPPPPKTVAEQILELNELLAKGKLTEGQHKLLVDALLRPR
jgi:hypothetical protein